MSTDDQLEALTTVTLQLPAELKRAIRKLAKARYQSMSDLIRQELLAAVRAEQGEMLKAAEPTPPYDPKGESHADPSDTPPAGE